MSLDKKLGEFEKETEEWSILEGLEGVPVPSAEEDERMAKLGEKFDLPEFKENDFDTSSHRE